MSRAVVAVAKQENNPTSIGLTQYLDPSYWTWAAEDANGAALLQQGAGPILTYIVQRLEAVGCEVVAGITLQDHWDVGVQAIRRPAFLNDDRRV